MADLTLLGRLAVVNRGLNHGLDESHASDDATDRDQMVDKVGLETAWGHVIAPKIAFEVNVEALRLRGEGLVVSVGSLLFGVHALTRVVHHLFYGAVELSFEHANGVDGVFGDELGEVWVLAPQIVDGDTESLALLTEHRLDVLAEGSLAHELGDSLLEYFLLEGCRVVCLVIGSPGGVNHLLHDFTEKS